MPKPRYDEEEDKRGSRDPDYEPPEIIWDPDPTKPKPWYPNGHVKISQPEGIWKPPGVYSNKKIVRFPTRPEVGIGKDGKTVKFGEFHKPFYRSNHLKPVETAPGDWEEKYIDPLAPLPPDARDWSQRVPQYSIVPQKCKGEKPGPPTHNRLHKAVASGDKKVCFPTCV